MIRISVDQKKIEEYCRKYHIKKLAFFGSILRDDFRPDSDVDVLVEFEQGHTPGFIRLAGMELELSALFKRKADLRTPSELSRYFRNEVLNSAQIQYAKK